MRIQQFALPGLWLCSVLSMNGSGHGPAFGLATPTNPKGGWSADLSLMSRLGETRDGWMMRGGLGYGITRDLKISLSAPVVFQREVLPPGRFAGFMPMGGDVEVLSTWRFHRQNTGVGQRWESAVIGGLLVDGPQAGPDDTRFRIGYSQDPNVKANDPRGDESQGAGPGSNGSRGDGSQGAGPRSNGSPDDRTRGNGSREAEAQGGDGHGHDADQTVAPPGYHVYRPSSAGTNSSDGNGDDI